MIEFMRAERVQLLTRSVDGMLDRLVMSRVLWLNPPGFKSEAASFNVPVLVDFMRRITHSSCVVGWHCDKCRTTYFAADLEGLRHEPCAP